MRIKKKKIVILIYWTLDVLILIYWIQDVFIW